MLLDAVERNYPPHAFPLQNPELERTKMYWSDLKAGRPTVVAGFNQMGGALTHLAVLSKLEEQVNIGVLTDGRGQEALERSDLQVRPFQIGKSVLPTMLDAVSWADVVLAGSSEFPGIEACLMANSQWDRLLKGRPPIVAIEDYPGGIARDYYGKKHFPETVIPDYMCVVSEWAKQKELKDLPHWYNPDRIIVTGQPAFDRFAEDDVVGTRDLVRQRLQLGEAPLIVHMGTRPASETVKALTALVDTLQQPGFEKTNLIFRPHPRDIEGLEHYPALYQSIADRVILGTNEVMVPALGVEPGKVSDILGMSPDVLMHQGSTAGLEAVYRGVPAVCVFISDPPRSPQEVFDSYPLPVEEAGASPLVTSPRQLTQTLGNMLHNAEYMVKLKEKMAEWKVDGQATDRVAELILNLAWPRKINE